MNSTEQNRTELEKTQISIEDRKEQNTLEWSENNRL